MMRVGVGGFEKIRLGFGERPKSGKLNKKMFCGTMSKRSVDHKRACAWNRESAKNIAASQGVGGGNGGATMRKKEQQEHQRQGQHPKRNSLR